MSQQLRVLSALHKLHATEQHAQQNTHLNNGTSTHASASNTARIPGKLLLESKVVPVLN
jgi:hypothetical protein